MFQNCISLNETNFTNLITNNVNDMSYLFDGCSSIYILDLSTWNTTNVQQCDGIFDGLSNNTILIYNDTLFNNEIIENIENKTGNWTLQNVNVE